MNHISGTDTTISVNYDEEAVAELQIDGMEYRIDAGKQGTALCLSTRTPGGWDWTYLEEIRFDGTDVRSKTLERSIRMELSNALREALAQAAEN